MFFKTKERKEITLSNLFSLKVALHQ